MITVRELIEQLQVLPPETTVWVATDNEGNYYRPLWQVAMMDTFETEEYDDVIEKWYKDVFKRLGDEEVVMLWPVN